MPPNPPSDSRLRRSSSLPPPPPPPTNFWLRPWCDHSNESSQWVHSNSSVHFQLLNCQMKPQCATIQMKALCQYILTAAYTSTSTLNWNFSLILTCAIVEQHDSSGSLSACWSTRPGNRLRICALARMKLWKSPSTLALSVLHLRAAWREWPQCGSHNRAVYTRENKPRIRQSVACLSRELSHLYEHDLYKKLVRGLRKPRTSFLYKLLSYKWLSSRLKQSAAYFPSYKRP